MTRAFSALLATAFAFLLLGCTSCAGFDPKHDLRLYEASDANLPHSRIVATLDSPLREHENVLWCGTFQLAWNEACSLIGEDVHTRPQPALVPQLNRKAFRRDQLDAASYLARAGFVRDGIYDAIAKEAAQRFRGDAAPRHLPKPDQGLRPQDFLAYAYLYKNLQFPQPFQRLEPLTFAGRPVPCFGVERDKDIDRYAPQVVILSYRDPNDFVVELALKGGGDRLILARVGPGKTLGETAGAVLKRIPPVPEKPQGLTPEQLLQAQRKGAEPLGHGDILRVPKFNFDLEHQYRDLVGLKVVSSGPTVPPDTVISEAWQNIRFRMDEKGVRLQSEALITFKGALATPRRIMVFDQPFLLMMKRTDAKQPYFVMWVGNPELWGPQ